MADINWLDIEAEYIATDISYRDLAKKYGISATAMSNHGRQAKLVEQRRRYQNKAKNKIVQKLCKNAVDRNERMLKISDNLADKIAQAVDSLSGDDGSLDTARYIGTLTKALRDLKDVQGLKSDLELQEQQARIRLLQVQADRDTDKDSDIRVILEGVDDLAD